MEVKYFNEFAYSLFLHSKLFVATLVLLPILGVTWMLGIFAVNENTIVFAWLFVIFNSLQVIEENVSILAYIDS